MAGNPFGFLADLNITGPLQGPKLPTGPLLEDGSFISSLSGSSDLFGNLGKLGAFAANPLFGAGISALLSSGILGKEKTTEEQIDDRFNTLKADNQGLFDSILADQQQSAQFAGRSAVVNAERAGVGNSGIGADATSGFEFGAFENSQNIRTRILSDLMNQARADVGTRISDPKSLSDREKAGLGFGAFETAVNSFQQKDGSREGSNALINLLQGKQLSDSEKTFVSGLFEGEL